MNTSFSSLPLPSLDKNSTVDHRRNSFPGISKVNYVIDELLCTERVYAQDLQSVIDKYLIPYDDPENSTKIPSGLRGQSEIIFGNIRELHDFHNRLLLPELVRASSSPIKICHILIKYRNRLLVLYRSYCQNKPISQALRIDYNADGCRFFMECQKEAEHQLPLSAYLLKPVQRITKYHLLLSEMLRFCREDSTAKDTCCEIQSALDIMLGILEKINSDMQQITLKGSDLHICVHTVDSRLDFAIQSNATGQQVFERVVKMIGVFETWFFGLQFTDSNGISTWLRLDKKISQQDIRKERILTFKFRAKFYPEDASEEIIQDVTLRLFYLQVREQILSSEVFCSAETSALLASHAVQIECGNYSESVHYPGFLHVEELIPRQLFDSYGISADEWEKRITLLWQKLKNIRPKRATIIYMQIAQELDMYGLEYFEICSKQGDSLYLGVNAFGMNIYERNNRINPKTRFLWSEIRNTSVKDSRFVIKLLDKRANEFVFYSPLPCINKEILNLCMGNNELFLRRRQAESDEANLTKQGGEEKHVLGTSIRSTG